MVSEGGQFDGWAACSIITSKVAYNTQDVNVVIIYNLLTNKKLNYSHKSLQQLIT